jgi:nucleoside-diphosphate-sugar epimerase
MQSLAGRRIALIGGAGFIGHNLALSLARRGARVAIVDSLQHNHLLAFVAETRKPIARDLSIRILHERLDLLRAADVPIHVLDARNYHKLSIALDAFEPQVIVHLAAIAHANRSNKDPYTTFDNSLVTLENALDNARSYRVDQFVYFSSSMVYGNFDGASVTEESPLEPLGIYGALKLAGEKMVIAYNQVFDLPYTIVRPSALYGPRCVSRRVGQIFIESALRGAELHVDGSGEDLLDFTYIDDLVHGIECTLEHPAAIGQIFNLTYGKARSIAEMAEVVREFFPDIRVVNKERDRLMPFRGTLSVDKARELIGYRPANPIEVGMPKYIEWYERLAGHLAEEKELEER